MESFPTTLTGPADFISLIGTVNLAGLSICFLPSHKNHTSGTLGNCEEVSRVQTRLVLSAWTFFSREAERNVLVLSSTLRNVFETTHNKTANQEEKVVHRHFICFLPMPGTENYECVVWHRPLIVLFWCLPYAPIGCSRP